MNLPVRVEGLLIRKNLPAGAAPATLVVLVRAPDVAVMGSMGCERLATEFALERLLPGVLPDVCAEDAGGGELLQKTGSRRDNFHGLDPQ